MKNENESLSRRSFLGQAVVATGILSALDSAGQASAQAPQAGGDRGGTPRQGFLRLRLEVLQGRCARRAAAEFRGRELEKRGLAA